ncbi:MAG: helix-turn-helix domain-containing protein [Lachnospiraceae bacterium]|nr:helix-turn-helix domain-containing protein [Lachnospiraceae bacterium]
MSGLFNISYQAVYKWRNGYSVPELDSLYYLSRMFGVTIDYIVCGEKEQTKAMFPAANPPVGEER